MRIHKEGRKIILCNFTLWAVIAACFILFSDSTVTKSIASAICLVMALFVPYFFRIPSRKEITDNSVIVSPGDGTVVEIVEVDENEVLHERCIRISMFLSIFNVHVTFFPIDGKVIYYKYHPGKYLVAKLPKASEDNEHTSIGMADKDGNRLMFRQIAGLIARRIICYAQEGKHFAQSEQAGIIKFGSRIDIFLPLGSEILVGIGDKLRGQITPVARFKKAE